MRFITFVCFAALSLGSCSGSESGPDLGVILADRPAARLADYGLFKDIVASEPSHGVVPYQLINPLFSDHARKDRLVFIPKGQSAEWTEEDVFAFPVGTVLIKSFSYSETGKLETRLLIHKAEGWAAYPYVWNAERTEAHYRPIGARREITITGPSGTPLDLTYTVPNQNQCKTCHQAGDAITPVGPKARNLGAAQTEVWEQKRILNGRAATFDVVPSVLSEEGTLDARARAYLDINCAHCHKADGAASNSGLWLSWEEQNLTALGVGKHPTAAGRGAGELLTVIDPGAPDTSILVYRMASTDPGIAMPELGRTLTDEIGLEVVRTWIAEMQED